MVTYLNYFDNVIIHYIPGRVRLRIPSIKYDSYKANRLIEDLYLLTGIIFVNVNTKTGTAKIVFNENTLSIDIIKKSIVISCNKINPQAGNEQLIHQSPIISDVQKNQNSNSLTLNNNTSKIWYKLDNFQLTNLLNTNIRTGLSDIEAINRLKIYGMNAFLEKQKPSLFKLFMSQFDGFMVKLLIGASVVSFFIGEIVDAVTIVSIVIVEGIIGTLQQYKAEKSLSELKKMTAPTACTIRNGDKKFIPAESLVPGDIILLEAGNMVPADSRIIEANNLEVVEASLTGESVPVPKKAFCYDCELCLSEQDNMVFLGTSVSKGNAKAIVVATGMSTEMGNIAKLLSDIGDSTTPLQKNIEVLAKDITVGCIGICSFLVVFGILRNQPAFEMLRTGISLAVGAIPEGLSAIVTISLAFGVQRMVKKNAVVRKLPSVESLGCTMVICSDKTGTLTSNEMTVKKVYTNNNFFEVTGEGYNPNGNFIIDSKQVDFDKYPELYTTLLIGAICNNANLTSSEGNYNIDGDPTEAALLTAAVKAGIDLEQIRQKNCRVVEYPFESEKMKMTVICKSEECHTSYTKGAPDIVLKHCSRIVVNGKIQPLTQTLKNLIINAHNKMAENALRVLALAYSNIDDKDINEYQENDNLIFTGLIGMIDPPKPHVKEAIANCNKSGVKVVMITGDHQNTSVSIAKDLGLFKGRLVVTGKQLENMDDNELDKIIDAVDVFARTSPYQKLRIVRAFKRRGYVVAMTGDGVNDAPAVKEADIGIAMGKSGTDVTREVSSITLTDDNFSTIVMAIEEGRTVNENIRKFMKYVLSGNMGEVMTLFLASVAGLPIPLSPGHILWINLVTEGIPALSLGVDPPSDDIMSYPPRDPYQNIFDSNIKRRILIKGTLIGITTFAAFAIPLSLGMGLLKARTMAFTNLVSCQMFNVFDSRRMGKNRKSSSIRKNKYIIPSVGISTAMLFTVLYLPVLSSAFLTSPLTLMEWGTILISSGVVSRIDNLFIDSLEERLNTKMLKKTDQKLLPEGEINKSDKKFVLTDAV